MCETEHVASKLSTTLYRLYRFAIHLDYIFVSLLLVSNIAARECDNVINVQTTFFFLFNRVTALMAIEHKVQLHKFLIR